MSLTLVSPAFLAWGSALLLIPILIHLLMRKKPVEHPFPTLRFLRQAQKRHASKVRMRHFLLLLLRCLLILLALLGFARPQLKIQREGGVGEGPLDVALVVDTSASMRARIGEPTLLARAQAHAKRIVEDLPRGSRVALIVDADRPVRWVPSGDRSIGAELDALDIDDRTTSLRPLVGRAVKLLGTRDQTRAPVVVLMTDMTDPPLPRGLLGELPDELAVQLIDVAGQPLDNAALDGLMLDKTAVLPNAPVGVAGELASYGMSGKATLELIVDGRTLSTRTIDVAAGARTPFRFEFRAPAPGVLQGRVQLREEDALEADNALYFTIQVAPTLKALVVTDGAYESSFGWKALQLALDPEERGRQLQLDRAVPAELARRDLGKYPVVLLPGVAALPAEAWTALNRYVRAGGALLALPGPGIDPASWRHADATAVLGAELVGPERLPEGTTWIEVDYTHAMLDSFQGGRNGDLTSVEWRGVARVEPAPGTAVIARVSHGRLPALIEAKVGSGRTLTLTGGLSPKWSDLVRHTAIVPLLHQALRRLVELSSPRLNAIAGETLELPAEVRGDRTRARVAGPGAARVLTIDRDAPVLSLALRDGPGHYRYIIDDEHGVVQEGGASASASTAESDLTRLDPETLAERLGREDLVVRAVTGSGELGSLGGATTKELTPLIAVLLLVLMTVESYWSTLGRG